MKIAYFDCPTGIAGDMCLGALVDAGVPLAYLEQQLGRLAMHQEFHLQAQTVKKVGIQGTQVTVHLTETPATRHLPEIEAIIQQAGLPAQATAWALASFRALAAAEGAVHGVPPSAVHFHEVGAVDAIVDIVGTCLGLDWLGIEQIVCSGLPFGGGTVIAAHGRMPVPTPAVVKLWQSRQVPVFSNGIHKELVTPTGAAIVCALAHHFGECPALVVQTVGMGAGTRDLSIPNLLRLWVGESTPNFSGSERSHAHAHEHSHSGPTHSHSHSESHSESSPSHSPSHAHPHEEVVALLETQLDDTSPQVLGYLFDCLPAAGALDMYLTPVAMKKNRPGVLLTVLCHPPQARACEEVLFRETMTLGIRRDYRTRAVLGRRFETVQTNFGAVPVKVSHRAGAVYTVQPEYEDCRRLAQATGQPLKNIHAAALQAYEAQR
ncbi:nickel pincer cofactor biosynthesis protein LarC [Candidatus Cyanaurora vandensis]|uniref:nickel pincer cofactor biosynthesis protein LarC n=1 Tax=Candidatus Cyanaurora vandensis TaxID=2714958 RepID=UPI00257D74D4|nr:nickel pincer cofactor biosynthesis protein LarC [Candidatus Cyanaurora vandensis]